MNWRRGARAREVKLLPPLLLPRQFEIIIHELRLVCHVIQGGAELKCIVDIQCSTSCVGLMIWSTISSSYPVKFAQYQKKAFL